uniref:Uncharacterized protein n=1 Tax=viral metagenome TaxID=1070528 RepID=A0A6M3XLW2_9ZZZZ
MIEARDKYWFIKRDVEHSTIKEIDSLISSTITSSVAIVPFELTSLQLGQSYIRHILSCWEVTTNELKEVEEERLERLERLKKESE